MRNSDFGDFGNAAMARKQSQTVLVVSETLSRGGLETRLLTQGRALVSRGHRVLYATASPELPGAFAELAPRTFTGLAIGAGSSARACAEAAEQLAHIIEQEGVDVVHAHPFASLTAGALGAALAGRPLTVTFHGPSSFTGGANAEAALFDFVLPYAASIRVVSQELTGIVPSVFAPRVHVLPNTVDLTQFEPLKTVPRDAPWAFIGRLADGKSDALATLMNWGPRLGIREVHVVGDGVDETATRERLSSADVKLSFIGWHDDVAALLRDGYAGVVGMGRVVLEAGALGLPCILAGYGELHGAVTAERFKALAFTNFSGRGMAAVDVATLAADLASLDDAGLREVRRCIEEGHDESRAVRTNEELLGAAQVDDEARARVLQLYAAFRGAKPDTLPWAQDYGITQRLRQLTRQPGQPFVQNSLNEVAALLESQANRVIADQQRQLAELTRAVAQLQQRVEMTLPDRLLEKVRSALDDFSATLDRREVALSERLDASHHLIAAIRDRLDTLSTPQQDELRRAWSSVKQHVPAPLRTSLRRLLGK